MSATVGPLAANGCQLRSVLAVPTGGQLFEYDYLLAFVGQGELASVERLGLRWVGAFTDIIAGRDGNGT